MSQKDTDAPWAKKNGQSYFGYKNHMSIDVEYGFIRRYQVMDASVHDASVHDASVHDASVHDSQVLGALLDEQNQREEVWADSAYRSESIEWIL
ncbi:Mobile element protein [Richelia intracellularis]|nr:Mobile element protein [Richelia intracellularis]